MSPVREQRLAWGALVILAGVATMSDQPPWWLLGVWGSLTVAGALALSKAPWTRHATWPLSPVQLIFLLGLLVFSALVFGPSFALLLSMVLALMAMATGSRVGPDGLTRLVERWVSLGGALVLVLVPLEFILRVPRVAREFGLPGEAARELASYDSLWAHNIFRFRSTSERVARSAGVRRVIALGDSFTWGYVFPLLTASGPRFWRRSSRLATTDEPK